VQARPTQEGKRLTIRPEQLVARAAALDQVIRSLTDHARGVQDANARKAMLWVAKQLIGVKRKQLRLPKMISTTPIYSTRRPVIPLADIPPPRTRRKVIDSSEDQRAARAAAIRGET